MEYVTKSPLVLGGPLYTVFFKNVRDEEGYNNRRFSRRKGIES